MKPLFDIYEETLETSPDRTAIIIGDKSASFRQLRESTDLYARALHGVGVRKGDRVALLMYNMIEQVSLLMACFRLGAIAIPMNYASRYPEVAGCLRHNGAKILVADDRLHSEAPGESDQLPSLERVCLIPGAGDLCWSAVIANAPETIPWPRIEPQDACVIMYSSGSTGRPKGSMHTHESLLTSAETGAPFIHLDRSSRFLLTSGFCHGTGLKLGLLACLKAGATSIFLEHFTPEAFLEAQARYRPTHVFAPPALVRQILEHPLSAAADYSSLLCFFTGGDMSGRSLEELFSERTGQELRNLIGITEMSMWATTPPDRKTRRGSLGLKVDGLEVRLVDTQGRDIQTGATGEILLRGRSMMSGYWNDPDLTASTIVNGWLHTGDLGSQDADGYYFFQGRLKTIIVRGGQNIQPTDVEDVLDAHPGVACSAVVGVPDEMWGEAVHAFVVVNPECAALPSAEELQAWTEARLSSYRVPERFWFVLSLPLNPNGKVDRRQLKAMAVQSRLNQT